MSDKNNIFDLIFLGGGNGITVCNRLKHIHGDWDRVAHINTNNPLKPIVKYFENATQGMKKEIQERAEPKFVQFENLKLIDKWTSVTQGTRFIYQDDKLLTTFGLSTNNKTHSKEHIEQILYSIHLKLIASELLYKEILNHSAIKNMLTKQKYKINSIEDIFNLPHPEFMFVKNKLSDNFTVK